MVKYIDMEHWERREHFTFFYPMDYPHFNVCMNIDVTPLATFCKTKRLSFYYAMIHAVTQAANETENFRYRIRDGKVVLHDRVHPSFTQMDERVSTALFKIITVDFKEDLREFVQAAAQENAAQKSFFTPQELTGERDDLLYLTCLPWFAFTQISHPLALNRNDSVPRISWGKYYREGDNILLPFSVQASHALMDGLHVERYLERLRAYMERLTQFI